MKTKLQPKIKETGKAGLTNQVTDYLKIAEKLYPICWYRNQQNFGSRRGRPDFEVGFKTVILLGGPGKKIKALMETVNIELKSPSRKTKLNTHQENERLRIENAGGEYHIMTSIDELHKIFVDRGYDRVRFS